MPIHYNVETDGLYLEGIEKGIEKNKIETVTRMLQNQILSLADIMLLMNVSETFVRKIADDLGIEVR